MIDQITIENFKAIGARVVVPIKPLTLLFGPNGAGKSSILQALFYLREILERNNLDAGYTLTCGDRIDLGGFRNFVHARDLRQSVAVGIQFPWFFDHKEYNGVAFESTYGGGGSIPCVCGVMASTRYSKDSNSYVVTFTVSYDDEDMFRVTPHHPTPDNMHVDFLNCNHHLWRRKFGEEFKSIKFRDDIIRDLNAKETALGFVSFDTSIREDFRATDLENLGGDDGFTYTFTEYSNMNDTAMFATYFTVAIREACNRINGMIAVGPLRDSPQRWQVGSNRPSSDPARWYTGLGAWDYLLRGETWKPALDQATDDIPRDRDSGQPDRDLVSRVSKTLKDALDTGFSLHREEVGYFVESTTDTSGNFLFSERLRSFAKQIGVLPPAELQAAYEEDVLQKMAGLKHEGRLILHDHRSDIDVAPHDIGVGISQVLPVVTAALSCHPLVVIEQPELHIHPRMQVSLGDVLLEGLKTKGKQFIIETHSEHLMLRLLRRIREGTFSPDDLAVVYVEPGDGQPGARSTRALHALHLRVDADGEFRDRWPQGFFEERGPEVFG